MWYQDKFFRGCIIAAISIGVMALWMHRFETVGTGPYHVNRITGVLCHVTIECWFSQGP